MECNERNRDVLQVIENSSAEKGISALNAFVKYFESSLYNEIEKPARHLHNSLSSFQREEKFSTLTKNDISSGRECLKFEVNVTEQAAQILLETIKKCFTIWLAIREKASDLFKRSLDKLNVNQQSITSEILRKLLAVAKDHAIQVQAV